MQGIDTEEILWQYNIGRGDKIPPYNYLTISTRVAPSANAPIV